MLPPLNPQGEQSSPPLKPPYMGNGYAAALACNVLRNLPFTKDTASGVRRKQWADCSPTYSTTITSISGSSATFVAFGMVTFIRSCAEEHMSFSSS
jgi:hypothetical protein